MTPLDCAFRYAGHSGIPIFPCREHEPGRKRPYVANGFHDASQDPDAIEAWWRQWPNALVGMPTGRISGRWVLDIDVKRPEANGFDTLEDLGHMLPDTPMVHTPSAGLHVYFDAGARELKNSAGLIGPGIDVRGDGGYVILPSPGSGYAWDPLHNFHTCGQAAAPGWLWPPKPSRPIPTQPIRPITGLDHYGKAALEHAYDAIVRAPAGEQEPTLNAECFSIGTLAGAGAVPADLALRTLLSAASRMPDHDPAYPWRPEEIDYKVKRAFAAGMASPREARRAVA